MCLYPLASLHKHQKIKSQESINNQLAELDDSGLFKKSLQVIYFSGTNPESPFQYQYGILKKLQGGSGLVLQIKFAYCDFLKRPDVSSLINGCVVFKYR